MTDQFVAAMVEFFAELELLAPADPAATSRAIRAIPLSSQSVVVDAGCGTGRQTFQLLRETTATIIATDIEASLLHKLSAKAAALGCRDRLKVEKADMLKLPFAPGSLDVIYSEGAIYNVGYEAGLRAWRSLLKPGGYVCVSDAAYTDDAPPQEARRFWDAEYPAITTAGRMEQIAADCGYRLTDGFWMPRRGWESYYTPVEKRIEDLAAAWAADAVRAQVLDAIGQEIELFRKYGDSYGYYFVVLQKSSQ